MNLYSKALTVIVSLLFCSPSWALNLRALYTSACQRHLGVILNVDDQKISFLSLEDGVVRIPRYEIIYLSDYPIDVLPSGGQLDIKGIPMVRITTMVDHKERLLLEGWPIGFNAEKIGFLKKNGGETVIDTRNIWSVTFVERPFKIQNQRDPKKYRFIHPYSFRSCPYKGSKNNKIFPQQILSDPIQIKRQLDALQAGFDRIRRYRREQTFYPKPEIYENRTELGVWFSTGSRHGASEKRTNNFLPVLVDQYSSDIFDFQQYSVTGSAPLEIGTHEEPQSQITYAFKASYFHFSGMVDPNLVLVGQNFEWQNADFETGKANTRHSDISIIELGFDFGNFILRAYGGTIINFGLWDGQNLKVGTVSVPRFGLQYKAERWAIELNSGSGSDSLEPTEGQNAGTLNFSVSRLNFSVDDVYNLDILYSFIQRDQSAPLFSDLKSSSSTHAAYFTYPYSKRVRLGGLLSAEMLDVTTTVGSQNEIFLKAGASVFVSF